MEEISKQKMRSISQVFLGDFAERVAVLGAFDTWSYMDYISRLLANNNYVAATSRYLYRKISGRIMRMRTQEHPGFAPQYHFLGALLDQIISDCASAVINFSVSAAHFVETDWCYKKSKKTLGIAYVRAISGLEKKSCENLDTIETKNGFYSTCRIAPGEVRTVWDCLKSSDYCPFISQEISKNVIEYFFRGRDMEIVAIEDIRVLPSLLDDKYPSLTTDCPTFARLDDDIAKHDEVFLTKDCIFFILRLNKLSQDTYINRLSKMKILALLERAPGWSYSMASNPNRVKYFVSRKLGEEEVISYLKNGFVDMDLIGPGYADLAKFLKEREYVELKGMESISSLEGTLVKMTTKGKKLAKLYDNL